MKRAVSFFFVLMAVATAFAQTGFKSYFGTESTEWHGATEYYDVYPESHLLQLGADTTIDGTVYKMVEYSSFDYYEYNIWRDSEYDFMVREDTATGRLWVRYADDSTEYLAADMTLETGDTMMVWRRHSFFDSYVYHVYAVEQVDGRRVIHLTEDQPDNEWQTVDFVEGMGCTNLLDFLRYDMINSWIICCHHDGELIYHHDSGILEEDCHLLYVGIDDIAAPAYTLRTSADLLTVEGLGDETVRLYDLQGRLLQSLRALDRCTLRVPAPGIYLLQVGNHKAEKVVAVW